MKIIQIFVYDPETSSVLTNPNLTLPQVKQTNEQTNSVDTVQELLLNYGMGCAIWSPVVQGYSVEIWQPIMFSADPDWIGETPDFVWTRLDEVDPGVSGDWKRNIFTKNLSKIVASNIKKDYDLKQEETNQ